MICEYPVEPKALAVEITHDHIERDANGQVSLPDAPGLGLRVNVEAANRYLIPTEIRVGGKTLYETPRARGVGGRGDVLKGDQPLSTSSGVRNRNSGMRSKWLPDFASAT